MNCKALLQAEHQAMFKQGLCKENLTGENREPFQKVKALFYCTYITTSTGTNSSPIIPLSYLEIR